MQREVLRLEIVKPVHNNTENPSPIVALPSVVEDVVGANPAILPILSGMATTNPITFLHQVMTVQVFRTICHEYTHRIPVQFRTFLRSFLASFEEGVLLHDKGKWGIDPDMETSIRIVNSAPGENNRNNDPSIDHRSEYEQAVHRLHPLAGGLMAGELNALITSSPLTKRTAAVIFSHHEQLREITREPSGRKIPSYPREKIRLSTPLGKFASILIKLSDTVVARGQPRTYKGRENDGRLMQAIELFFNDNNLRSVFDRLTEFEKIQIRGVFLSIAFLALHQIQRAYPPGICLEVSGFTLFGKPLEKPKKEVLQDAASLVWEKHGDRLLRTLDETIPSIEA